jgi:hypothetical protein
MTACQNHPDVWAPVSDVYSRKVAAQKATVMNFDHLSKSVWKDLNITYIKLSGSKQYDASFDVMESINNKVSSVVRDSATPMASEGTRKNGLEILRRFAKSILLSGNDTLGHEVQVQCQSDCALVDAMKKIVRAMGVEERERVLRDAKGGYTEFGVKLPEVIKLAKEYLCFEEMEDVLVMLEGGEVDGEEGEFEEGEEEYDEAEGEEEEYGDEERESDEH